MMTKHTCLKTSLLIAAVKCNFLNCWKKI